MKVRYAKDGVVVSDFALTEWINGIVANLDVDLCVSNSTPIHAIRLAIAEGRIPHDRVIFLFEDLEIAVNEYGAIPNWPIGFADACWDLSTKILQTAQKKRRELKYGAVVEVEQYDGDYRIVGIHYGDKNEIEDACKSAVDGPDIDLKWISGDPGITIQNGGQDYRPTGRIVGYHASKDTGIIKFIVITFL